MRAETLPVQHRAAYPHHTWWTQARVVAGLQRFHRDHHLAPTSTDAWHALTATRGGGGGSGRGRPYPSFYGVLRYFPTFRQAWMAAGVDVDQQEEEWSELEEWYLVEAIGIIPREEIARDLRRSDGAVKRRLYDLGLKIIEARGWTANRVQRVAQLPSWILRKYMAWGELPFFKGSKCVYFDPADLLVVQEIDWQHPPAELEEAVRLALRGRLVKVLAGQDWRTGRLYKPEQTVGWGRSGKWRRVPIRPGPKPSTITVADQVRATVDIPARTFIRGRVGVVQLVYWSGNRIIYNPARGSSEPCWMARVEFKHERRLSYGARVHYSLPLEVLEKVRAEQPGPQTLKLRCACGGIIVWRSDEPAPLGCAFCGAAVAA